MIPTHIPTFDELGLPNIFSDLADLPQGLVIVTGPTGSGKTSTLAAMLAHINDSRAAHILTIEDPIEFVHKGNRSVVSQREVGLDSPSFEQALRSALRENPDVLLIGEMRDRESIAAALTISETGHLVFSTLHTNDTAQTIDRIVDVFESWRRDQVREQFAASISAIISQRLVARVGGGRVAAFEILLATSPVRNLVREGKSNQLYNAMTLFRTEGMRTMEMSLYDLLSREVITEEVAFSHALHPAQLKELISSGSSISF